MKYYLILWPMILILMACKSNGKARIGDIKYVKLVYSNWDQSFGFIIATDSNNLKYAYKENSGESLMAVTMKDKALFDIFEFLIQKANDSIATNKIEVLPTYIVKINTKSDTLQYFVQGELKLIDYLDGLINHLKMSPFVKEHAIIIKELEFRLNNIKRIKS